MCCTFFTDYVRVGQSSLVFNTNGTQNIIVSIVNDDILEMTESFSISLSNLNPGPPLVEFGNSEVIITILDNDIRELSSVVYRGKYHVNHLQVVTLILLPLCLRRCDQVV